MLGVEGNVNVNKTSDRDYGEASEGLGASEFMESSLSGSCECQPCPQAASLRPESSIDKDFVN